MSRPRPFGFSLVEVPLALLVLVVGVLATAGSAAMVARMIGRGRHTTALALVAGARIERLRALVSATSPPCQDPGFASGAAVSGRIRERWELSPAGDARQITLTLEHPEAGGTVQDTLRSAVLCR
jgi:Tfp pilus assembly protein PilV